MIVDVGDPEAARVAAAHGAEAIVVRGEVGDLRAVTELPILWRASGSPTEAALAGADAWLVVVEDAGEDEEWLIASTPRQWSWGSTSSSRFGARSSSSSRSNASTRKSFCWRRVMGWTLMQ